MTVHIVGGGVAGLAAALGCIQNRQPVVLYEAAPQLGGRCRSYHHAEFGCELDNGAHVVLANNENTQTYLALIGAQNQLRAYDVEGLRFHDLRQRSKWTLRFPHGFFSPRARPSGLSAFALFTDCLRLLQGRHPASTKGIDTLWEPLCTAALNTPLAEADISLLVRVMRGMAGWSGLRKGLWLPKTNLSTTYIQPAVTRLLNQGVTIRTNALLRGVKSAACIESLVFDGETVHLGPADRVILALPPWAPVLQELGVNSGTMTASPIVNIHFKLPQAHEPQFNGLVGGISQWLWVRDTVATVTVSAADQLVNEDPRSIATTVWQEIAALVGGAPNHVAPAHVLKERRATLRHTPGCTAHRTQQRLPWANVTLAGDWTVPDLPCTLEAAVQSGFAAAQKVATADSN